MEDKRQYRKYTPWIFFLAEMILVFEILYTTELFVQLGNMFLFIFLIAVYYRLNKLLFILDRQNKLLSKRKREDKRSELQRKYNVKT